MPTKTVAASVKTTSDTGSGGFTAIISAATLDRDGEILDARCFEPLPDRISVDIDHGLSVAATIGSGRPYYEGSNLMIDAEFSSIPRAQEVRTLVTEGHIRGLSVAFFGAKTTVKDGVRHVTKAELLNVTVTPAPSNREALVVSAKSGRRGHLEVVRIDQGGGTVSRADDELRVRAAAIRIKAMAALAGVPMSDPTGKTFEWWEPEYFLKTLRRKIGDQVEREMRWEAQRRPGAVSYATWDPTQPPVPCRVVVEPDPECTGAYSPTFDGNGTTEHNPEHDAAEYFMGAAAPGNFTDERDPDRR